MAFDCCPTSTRIQRAYTHFIPKRHTNLLRSNRLMLYKHARAKLKTPENGQFNTIRDYLCFQDQRWHKHNSVLSCFGSSESVWMVLFSGTHFVCMLHKKAHILFHSINPSLNPKSKMSDQNSLSAFEPVRRSKNPPPIRVNVIVVTDVR